MKRSLIWSLVLLGGLWGYAVVVNAQQSDSKKKETQHRKKNTKKTSSKKEDIKNDGVSKTKDEQQKATDVPPTVKEKKQPGDAKVDSKPVQVSHQKSSADNTNKQIQQVDVKKEQTASSKPNDKDADKKKDTSVAEEPKKDTDHKLAEVQEKQGAKKDLPTSASKEEVKKEIGKKPGEDKSDTKESLEAKDTKKKKEGEADKDSAKYQKQQPKSEGSKLEGRKEKPMKEVPAAKKAKQDKIDEDDTKTKEGQAKSEVRKHEGKKSKEQKPEEPPVPKMEKLAFQTPSLPIQEGERINWLSVRKWYEHAQDVVKDIDQLLPSIAQLREGYITTRDEMENQEEKMFLAFGFDQVKLLKLLHYIKNQVEQKNKELDELSEAEQTYIKKLQGQTDEFDQLSIHVNDLFKLNDMFDRVIKVIIDQITRASSYRQKAHGYLERIPQGTMQAKEGYYHIDALYKSMRKIQGYLTTTLQQFFNIQCDKKQQLVADVKKQLTALKKDGIEMVPTAKRLEKIAFELEQKRSAKTEQEDETVPGVFGRLWNWISGFWSKKEVEQETA